MKTEWKTFFKVVNVLIQWEMWKIIGENMKSENDTEGRLDGVVVD
jgi:hypothetical protein